MQGGWNPPGQGGGPGHDPSQPAYGQPQQPAYGQPPPPAYPSQPGFPPQQPGFAQPPAPAPAPYRAPTFGPPSGERGFFGSLFDFSFTSFVTTKVLKVLYGLLILGAFGAVIVADIDAIDRLGRSYVYNREQHYITLVASPFALLLLIIYARMICEMIVVAFRIAENLGEINRKTRE